LQLIKEKNLVIKNNSLLVIFALLISLLILTACSSIDGDIKEFKVQLATEGAGQINPTEGEYSYVKNKKLSLSAIAAEGWKFKEWQGSLKSDQPQEDLVVNSNLSIKAVFVRKKVEVNHYQFASEDNKLIDLGIIAEGEEAVVAITPLDLSSESTDNYDTAVNIDYASNQKNKLRSDLDKMGSSQQNLSMQEVMDAKLRRKEEKNLKLKRTNDLQSLEVPKQSYQVGDSRKFYDGLNNELRATIRKISDKALIYVEEGYSIPATMLDEIAAEYDNNIYGIVTNNFGNTNASTYDWDENGKLTILITDMSDYGSNKAAVRNSMLAGYFYSRDYFSAENYETSNETDMVYINYQFVEKIAAGEKDLNQLLGTVAHEFQHLIYFVEKFKAKRNNDDLWINEGFSGLAEYLTGYNNLADSYKINSFYFGSPTGESLLFWDEADNSILGDYGGSMLFVYYLYNRYGSEIITEINSSSQGVIDLLDDKVETGDFSNLFLDWLLANQIYNKDNIKEKYQYPIDFETTPLFQRVVGSNTSNFTLRSTAVKYFKIIGDGSEVTLELDLATDAGVVTYLK
jgi:hypothetical protein